MLLQFLLPPNLICVIYFSSQIRDWQLVSFLSRSFSYEAPSTSAMLAKTTLPERVRKPSNRNQILLTAVASSAVFALAARKQTRIQNGEP
ncbi:hypothetical protein JAAARDRAFT_583759 [Jaapia argillacea MUCL 33604]|uniref:Uncharacterized protein n=1 Tax=Jaapia argillacea MUCL 33604 TaxID=933084 RepID=A0A067P682_9AGAM|nr:hypothetical protein JAAARDRAFT_583759 [Jaapia argillacea MUCL 33604]